MLVLGSSRSVSRGWLPLPNQGENMTDIPLDKLEPHPYNQEVLPDNEPSERFVGDIVKKGIKNPLAVIDAEEDELYHILDGKQRWRAAVDLDWEDVPCRILEIEDEEDVKRTVLLLNDYRDENFTQKVKTALEYEKLLAPYFEARMKDGTGRRLEEIYDPDEDDPLSNLPDPDVMEDGHLKGTRRAYAADRVGWSSGKYQQAKTVWKAKKGEIDINEDAMEDELSQEQLKEIRERIMEVAAEEVKKLDAGEQSVYGAYQQIERWKTMNEEGFPVPWDLMRETNLIQFGIEDHFEGQVDDLDSDQHWEQTVRKLVLTWVDGRRQRDIEYRVDSAYGAAFIFAYLCEKEGFGDAGVAEKKPTADQLHQLHWEEGWRASTMAVSIGVHPLLVQYWLEEEDIPLKWGQLAEGNRKMLWALVPSSYHEKGFNPPNEGELRIDADGPTFAKSEDDDRVAADGSGEPDDDSDDDGMNWNFTGSSETTASSEGDAMTF